MEETSIEDFDYISIGLEKMFEARNCGFLPAFPSQKSNKKGILLSANDFNALLEEHEVRFSLQGLPEQFRLVIKYSPIAQFKKWIFHLSNRDLLKISERDQAFEKDFFFLFLEDIPHFFALSTNIAHESFLESVYFRASENVSFGSFSCPIEKEKKLIVYKDYKNRKISSVNIPKQVGGKKRGAIRVAYVKRGNTIQFNVDIDRKHKVKHLVRLKKEEIAKKKVVKTADALAKLEEYKAEVKGLLEAVDGKQMETNRHANISLGRVNKIPLLVNLPKRFSDIGMTLRYSKQTEVLKVFDNEDLIKSFQLSTSPKSNWLKAV